MKKVFLVCFVLFYGLTIVSATAASIRNTDQKTHTLLVKENTFSYQVSLEPNGFIKDLCSHCTVEVLGYSILDVEDEPLLQVIDGRIEVKN